MLAQILYDFREKFEVFSGQDLHEFFNEQVGDPSPSGYTEIDDESADRFVVSSIKAMEWNSPSLSEHCDNARKEWREIKVLVAMKVIFEAML